MKRTMIVAAAALTLCGCSPDQPGPETAPETTQGSTVEQYASVISRHESTLRNVGDDKSTCLFDVALEPDGPAASKCVSDSEAAFDSISDIQRRFDELAEPPEEIADLVDRMQRAVDHVVESPEFDVATQCETIDSDECATAISTMTGGMNEVMIPELDAWKPYL